MTACFLHYYSIVWRTINLYLLHKHNDLPNEQLCQCKWQILQGKKLETPSILWQLHLVYCILCKHNGKWNSGFRHLWEYYKAWKLGWANFAWLHPMWLMFVYLETWLSKLCMIASYVTQCHHCLLSITLTGCFTCQWLYFSAVWLEFVLLF